MLDRVGAAIADNQTIKSTPQKAIKKKADAYRPVPRWRPCAVLGSLSGLGFYLESPGAAAVLADDIGAMDST
jgi:hypothetical protein